MSWYKAINPIPRASVVAAAASRSAGSRTKIRPTAAAMYSAVATYGKTAGPPPVPGCGPKSDEPSHCK